MKIGVAIVGRARAGIDTAEDLERFESRLRATRTRED